MQRIYIALAIALCVSTVVADFPGASNWAKTPVQVIQDSETNFTNQSTVRLTLANANPGELSVVGYNVTVPAISMNQNTWNTWWKKIDSKALTVTANSTATFTMPAAVTYSNGYAYQIVSETDTATNITALRVYQAPLNGGSALAKLTLNAGVVNGTISLISAVPIGKVVYPFYTLGNGTIRFTSFTVGSVTNATENTLTNAADAGTVMLAYGESLGSSQVLAYWKEAGVAKDAVVDVTKGSSTPAAVSGITNQTCGPFATDKKIYGEICFVANMANWSVSAYVAVRSNASALSATPLTSYNINNTGIAGVSVYSGYLVLWLNNATNAAGPTTLSYEIWDLTTSTIFKARTTYLTYDTTKVGYSTIQMPMGSLYGLLYNLGGNNLTYTTISVGVVLAGSYLTTILGFVMTIVAGLFLF